MEQTFKISRGDLISIFREWNKRAVDGKWPAADLEDNFLPVESADVFIDIAKDLKIMKR
jgi:hypothetical protein